MKQRLDVHPCTFRPQAVGFYIQILHFCGDGTAECTDFRPCKTFVARIDESLHSRRVAACDEAADRSARVEKSSAMQKPCPLRDRWLARCLSHAKIPTRGAAGGAPAVGGAEATDPHRRCEDLRGLAKPCKSEARVITSHTPLMRIALLVGLQVCG